MPSGSERTVIVNRRGDFTLENFRQVTVQGQRVAIGDVARRAMADARSAFVSSLEQDRNAFTYGVTSPPRYRGDDPRCA